MPEIVVFCEDTFHEKFIQALLERFETDYGISVTKRVLSARGGFARMHSSLTTFLSDLAKDREHLPDAIVIAADANCKGVNARKTELRDAVEKHAQFKQIACYAIPDPHIERWMLVDSAAFRSVFDRGCTLPAVKCAKNEYKTLLRQEISASGIEAPLGGQEYIDDIVLEMNLGRAETSEPSLGDFLAQLKAFFNSWSSS
jgi:hypothetical protein